MERDELAARISAVSQLSGSFRLRSGTIADTYFDKYLFESDPIPVVTALSIASGLPSVFVRKEAKEYGTAKLAEGPDISGRRLLIVEDVVTTGGQIMLSTADLRAREAIVSTAICVIDRQAGGSANLAEADVELRSAFTRSDIER